MNKLSVKIYRKLAAITDGRFKNIRKAKLNNRDFTIICNNCWAGYVYRRYGIPYLTPTVGLYFFADEFVKLCSDLKRYMSTPIEFIPYTESKHRQWIEGKNQQNVPIGRLDDIEIVFLHYKTEAEAREKWERRVERINYNNLIFKFSKMNGCTEQELKQFDQLECNKKFCFVPPADEKTISCAIPYKSARGRSEIVDDTSEYARYIDIEKLINSQYVNGRVMR